ncbi:uncharacterized protein LOC100501358 [Zea mays]|uniref:Uncharacterized protein n=1 Tax=Zea mays TaxID=4577 RepID=C4J2S6_MAIZE|nr:uncharacterized protein LOC100501358 [Zea mays]ACR35476.1 unknown [Zea mays]|eukprot:NP_001183031.1 uncharacterized protein LOC100501358 [Zea mays]
MTSGFRETKITNSEILSLSPRLTWLSTIQSAIFKLVSGNRPARVGRQQRRQPAGRHRGSYSVRQLLASGATGRRRERRVAYYGRPTFRFCSGLRWLL